MHVCVPRVHAQRCAISACRGTNVITQHCLQEKADSEGIRAGLLPAEGFEGREPHAEPSHGPPLSLVGKDMRPTGVRSNLLLLKKSEQSSAFGTGTAAQLAVGDQWPQPWLFRSGWQWCAGAVCLEWLQWSMHHDVTVVTAFGVNATVTGCVTVGMALLGCLRVVRVVKSLSQAEGRAMPL